MFHGRSQCRAGFTLVELAVVLVIIGLVIGGLMIGKAIITQAEIRAVIAEYDHYLKAVQEFQDKYNAMPGDMNNATDFWGEAATCPLPFTDSLPITTLTCDGDGDGLIAPTTDSGTVFGISGALIPEAWRAWQHLSNAGLVSGKYTGTSSNHYTADIGINVPASQYRGGGWTLLHLLRQGEINDHVFLFGGMEQMVAD